MRTLFLLNLFICLLVPICAVAESKPLITVAQDGFPTGQDTPEGAACGLVRAFIDQDEKAFRRTSIRVYSGGESKSEYEAFLNQTMSSIKAERARKTPSGAGPKSIGKVFSARPLSLNGPASYGYAMFGFQDIKFVDVGVYLHSGDQGYNRTLVIKDRDGKWYAHPLPSVSPLLSEGLNQEAGSSADFSDVYRIDKK